MIGTFGRIVFEVSGDKIRTFSNFSRKTGAVFGEHQILGGKPLLQFSGQNNDEVSFKIQLNYGLGVNPFEEISTLRLLISSGDSANLIIGGKVIGKFVAVDLNESWRNTIGGFPYIIEADLTLKEYNA